MSIRDGIESLLNNKLDTMRTHFHDALTTKAVEKLEERKMEIAQSYFGRKE